MIISDTAGKALYGACYKNGPHKGMLLKNAPKERLARAAWYGAQSVCNPYKLSIYAIMSFGDEERAIYREVEAIMDAFKAQYGGAPAMDRDRVTLERLGVW